MLKKQNCEERKEVNMAIESVSRYPSSPAEATEPPKATRISFSVASILADTKANRSSVDATEMIRHHRSIPESPLRQSPSSQNELPGCGKNLQARPSSATPPLNLNASANVMSSDDEYEDSLKQEDSIVDVEDLQNGMSDDEESSRRSEEKERMGPIRPTPFSALAAAAAAYHGLGGWPGAPSVVPSFGPLFQSHFPGHLTG